MSAILLLILGAILGIVFTVIYSRYSRPTIIVTIGEKADGETHRFVHLDVSNKLRKGAVRFIRGNTVAEYVKVRVNMLDPTTNSIVFDYIARWSSKAEPVESITGNHGTFNPALAIEAEREILLPGEKKSLTIALKYDAKDQFSGFNNWSYQFPEWENPEWTVNLKTALLKVEVFTDGNKLVKKFALQNPSRSKLNFKLSEINK
jgi:hypothetical protein